MKATADDFFEVTVPGEMQLHRRMMRYRVVVEDDSGQTVTVPYSDDPQRNFAWFCYGSMPAWHGTNRPGRKPPVAFSEELMRSMPAIHLIADEQEVTKSQYNRRYNERFLPGTVVFDGKVYDHIRFRNRGETTTYMTGKNKWRINFNRGHELEPPIGYQHTMSERWRRLNLNPGTVPYNPVFRGNASLHERIGMRIHQLAGLPASDTCYLQLRVIDSETEFGPTQYEGDVWGLYMGFEAIDGRFLDNHGLPDGELYKIAQSGTSEERSSPTNTNTNLLSNSNTHSSGFQSLWRGAQRRQSEQWWRQQIDIENYVSYHAVSIAIARHDQKLNHKL